MTTLEIDEAIAALQRARSQLSTDGRLCAVCGDNDHQAFECHHNPLVLARRWQAFLVQADALHDHLHDALGMSYGGRR